MLLRAITPADVPALFVVRTAARENVFSRAALSALGITEASVAAGLAGDCRGWLGEEAGQVVGFCLGDRSTGELCVLAVLPEFEGRGIGSALLRRTENWLWAEGCPRLWLWTSTDRSLRAYVLYRKRGWVETGEKDGQLFMEKSGAGARNPFLPEQVAS